MGISRKAVISMGYLELLLGFLHVGCFAFGGAYAAIPLIRDVVLSYGWLTDEELTYMIAVGESTPGPIMVNLATYIGSAKAGFAGAVLATFAVVLPAFLIIILITALLKNFIKNPYVQAVLRGLKPCVTGIILATGCYMVFHNCADVGMKVPVSLKAVILTVVLFGIKYGYQSMKKKKMSPIVLILISSVAGMIVYGI